VSWRNQHDEVAYVVADSGCKLVFAEADAGEVMTGLPAVLLGSPYEDLLAAEEDTPLPPATDPPLFGLRFYTSGTTGRPKAVVRDVPSGAVTAAMRAMAAPVGGPVEPGPDGKRPLGRGQTEGLEGPDEVHLLVGPAYHTAPGTFANRALQLFGQTIVVMRHFDAEDCLRLIESHRVTWSHMVPINFVRILAVPDEVRRRVDLSSIRRILHAAAPCPVGVKHEIMAVFPPGAIYEYYGATEGLVSVCPADEWLTKPGTVGRAAPGIEIRILDDDGVEQAPGDVGTIYFSTMVPVRYDGAPDKTEQARRGDLFTVGDMGYLDDDGYLFICDRAKDLIISGGVNIYPAEVEGVLAAHRAVGDVAVIGVPDAEWGEQVKAVVELTAGVAPSEELADQLMAWCRERLAGFKCPRSIDFRDELPRTDGGKLSKRQLRDEFWTATGRRV
jgi:long-chain acyl-CoA synthetase